MARLVEEFAESGRRFGRERRAIGLNQAELAAEFGVTRDTVCRWEQGYRRIKPCMWLALKYLVEKTEESPESAEESPESAEE